MLKVVGASWMKIRMSTWIIGIVFVLGIVVVIIGQMGQLEEDGNYSATAYWNTETGFEIKFWGQGMDIEKIPKGAARVYFQPHIDTTGWAIIDIETQADYPDWVQAYAAGMLEGSLSWQLIYWHWKNTVQTTCENRKRFCNYVRKHLEENLKSVKELYENSEDPYWHQVHLFYVQLEGIQQGFEHGVKRSRQTIEELTFVDFLWINAASDIVDLEYKFFDTKPYAASLNHSLAKNIISDSVLLKKIRNVRSVDGPSDAKSERRPHFGCGVTLGSAFIKLVPEEGRLLVAHNSAGPYVSMLRMIKHYQFRYHWSATNFWMIENKLSFSSYPGAIHSMDDFYVISTEPGFVDMVIAGTPITVFNKSLWKYVSPLNQVLSGPRAIVAGRLSKNASVWSETFVRYNSGTGNKEWMIVAADDFKDISKIKARDKKKYEEALEKATNLLWVVEQIPGHVIMEDQTEIFKKRTYWASYGLPFYKNISDISGLSQVYEQYGDSFSYENSPLANIYRRDQSSATTLETVTKLMRSNSYRKDPLSLGDPRCAIGARGDIPSVTSLSFPIGVIDSKIYSIEGDALTDDDDEGKEKSTFQVIAGPACSSVFKNQEPEARDANEDNDDDDDNDDLEPFNWPESGFDDFPHNGHPDVWDFQPIRLT